MQDGLLLEKSRLCQTRVVLNDQLLVADHGDLFALGLALKLCVQLLDLNVQVCGNLGQNCLVLTCSRSLEGGGLLSLGVNVDQLAGLDVERGRSTRTPSTMM